MEVRAHPDQCSRWSQLVDMPAQAWRGFISEVRAWRSLFDEAARLSGVDDGLRRDWSHYTLASSPKGKLQSN